VTGAPYVYELDATYRPAQRKDLLERALGDKEQLAEAAKKVADQAKPGAEP
jgi:hypothetical protein